MAYTRPLSNFTIVVSVDGLSGFLTGVALILLILTVFFGPAVLVVAVALPIIFLELYLVAYYPGLVVTLIALINSIKH